MKTKDQGIALRIEFWLKKREVRAKYAFPLSTYRERRAENFRPVLKVGYTISISPQNIGDNKPPSTLMAAWGT